MEECVYCEDLEMIWMLLGAGWKSVSNVEVNGVNNILYRK